MWRPQPRRAALALLLCCCIAGHAGRPAAGRGRTLLNFAGPYFFSPVRFSMCDGLTDKHEKMYLSFNRFNPYKPYANPKCRGNWTLLQPYDDDRWTSLIMDIRANNQWKENHFVLNTSSRGSKGSRHFGATDIGACSSMRKYGPAHYKFLFQRDPQARGECFIPPGLHIFDPDGYTHGKWKGAINVLPYGHYRLRWTTGRHGQVLSCVILEANVIPTPT